MAVTARLPDEELNAIDIAELNLATGDELPGLDHAVAMRCLKNLNDWARQVDANTKHWWPEYEANLARYNHSPAPIQDRIDGHGPAT